MKKKFGILYAVVRPLISSTVPNFVGLKSYTVQMRVVHCTTSRYDRHGDCPRRLSGPRGVKVDHQQVDQMARTESQDTMQVPLHPSAPPLVTVLPPANWLFLNTKGQGLSWQ